MSEHESYYYEIALTPRQVVVLFIVLLIGGLSAFLTGVWVKQVETAARTESLDGEYEDQLEAMARVKESTEAILAFVKAQELRLQRERSTLESLQEQRATIQKLLDADKQTVDALFRYMEQSRSATSWPERLMGFGIGILASVLASFLYAEIARQKNVHRS